MKIVERFLTQQINLEENSIINYRNDIEKFLKHCSQILSIPIEKENELLDNISVDLIEDIFNTYREIYKKKTINRRVASCNTFGEYLVNRNIWASNKFSVLLYYNYIDDKREYYMPTTNEINAMLSTSEKDNNKLRGYRTCFIISLMATTGLRINNVLKLQFSQLEKTKDTYMINFTIQQMKNNRGCRIPLSERTLYYYNKYIEYRNRLNIKECYKDYIIIGDKGKPLTSNSVARNIRRLGRGLIQSNNLSNLVNHSFREYLRTTATKLNFNRDLIYLIGNWSFDRVSACYVVDGTHLDKAKLSLCNALL